MFTIHIAEHDFRIDNKFPYIEQMCRNYIIPDCIAPTVSVTVDEIRAENRDGSAYPDGYLESLAVYRKICARLLADDVVLFHCSALTLDGEAVLFTAPSGTGKSTHARLWKRQFGERVTIINDDKPLLAVCESRALVYGTPWCGKHGLETNTFAPVSAIFLLEQSPINEAVRLTPSEAFPMLLNQTHRLNSADEMRRILTLTKRLAQNAALFRLKCNISTEAALTARNAWKGAEQ